MKDNESKLVAYLDEIVAENSLIVLDIVFKKTKPVNIDIILDKEGGIGLGECAKINKTLNNWIEENDLFYGNYVVDVCSPGLDRELKTAKDFNWAKGKKVKIILRKPVDSKGEIEGLIEDISDDTVTVIGETEMKIDIINVSKAKLVPDI